MGLLAIGAGASEGLDQMLARMLSEQQFARQAAAQQESARHNQADEALKGKQIDVMGQVRGDAAKANADAKTAAEQDRQTGILKGVLAATPGGSDVSPTLKMKAIDSGAAVPANFSFQPENMGRSTPQGELGPTPDRTIWEGTSGNQLAQQRQTDAESKTPKEPGPQVGSFGDYLTRLSGGDASKLTPAMIEGARKTWGEEGRRDPTQNPPHYQLQPELDPTGKPTGKFFGYNTQTNKFELIGGATPGATKAPPGAGQQATEAASKKDALDTLAQLDQSVDAAKDLIGPGPGRVSNIEQMIGNPDPRIQDLGVKMKAAKMRADHAITGSVRAGASPYLLQQWDNILANKVDYDGLKASVKALRDIIGGTGGGATAGAGAPGRIRYDIDGNRIP